MRKCKCTFWDKNTNSMVTIEGLFHCWGANYIEFEAGPGNYTIGIVELKGGRIVECDPMNIHFLTDADEKSRETPEMVKWGFEK